MREAPEHLDLAESEAAAPASLALERPVPIRITIGGQKIEISEVEALDTIGVLAGILAGRKSRG
jgi:hypothetical protein